MKLRFALVGAGLATAMLSGASVAGIQGSKHDLGANGGGQLNNAGTTEVCVFCHTPHGADTQAPAPLWNRSLALPTGGYQRYSDLGTATLDGEELEVGSVSLACLSCHDGTQAMDSVINTPGSGLNSGIIGGAVGTPMSGTPVPMLGTDLQNDHPISIEYAGGACSGATADCDPRGTGLGAPPGATKDIDFKPVQFQTINGLPNFWVDVDSFHTDIGGNILGTGTPDARDKTDMILYTRTFTNGAGPSVECASCHDPHESAARPVSFMRISNSNSEVCLACHIK